MPIFFNANYSGVAAFEKLGAGSQTMESAIRYGMFAVAQFWHENILPNHFERGANRKYKHKRRKKKYSAIKRKFALGETIINPETGQAESHSVVKGGVVDIAFEGHTERKAEESHSIRVTRNGFVLKMRVPRYILGRRRGDYPNMRKELSYITTEEAMLLGRVWWQHAKKFLTSNRNSTQFRT